MRSRQGQWVTISGSTRPDTSVGFDEYLISELLMLMTNQQAGSDMYVANIVFNLKTD